METYFKGVIFTNHAIERLQQRGIKQGDAWATLQNPNSSRESSNSKKGSWVFYRDWGNRRVEVVAAKNEKKEWVVLSVWDKQIPNWKKSSVKMKDPIWKRVLKELLRIFIPPR